ncbi:MAG: helix-turn-helix transcriptional regulator [Elusimicrobiales bacterium]|nr:helix-turn-helix transcriptional regulator [Elusimicrobiales bacterium]
MKRKKLMFDDWLKREMKNPTFKKAFEEEDIRTQLAYLITEKRHKKRISQAELARRIHTKQQVISDIETLRRPNLTLGTLQKIAHALGTRLSISLL